MPGQDKLVNLTVSQNQLHLYTLKAKSIGFIQKPTLHKPSYIANRTKGIHMHVWHL